MQVKQSVERILRIKLEYLRDENREYRFSSVSPEDIDRYIPSDEAENFFLQNASEVYPMLEGQINFLK